MWASSIVSPRTRVSPCTTPDFSYRYTAPNSSAEDQAVHRAVHRLEVVVLAGLAHRAVLVELRVDVHRREHAVGVPVQVARGVEQLRLGDVRRVHELVDRLDVLAA